MRVAVLTFQPPAIGAPQTQTITGVEDADGPFEGTVFVFQSAYAALDTVTSGFIPTNAYMDGRGLAFGVFGSGGVGCAGVTADVDTAGIKDAAGMGDQGDCVSDFNAQLSFGGAGWRHACVSAVAPGTFDLQYNENDRTGDTVLCTVFGGTDLVFDEIDIGSATYTTAAKPQGVLCLAVPGLSASRSAATGTGGSNVTRGWDTPAGNRGSSYVGVFFADPVNHCDQFTDTLFAAGGAGGVQVTAWTDTSLTITNTVAAAAKVLAVCGTNIRCAAGVITQPASTGPQAFTTGIAARWINFIGNGFPADSGQQTVAQAAVGWGDNLLNQVGFWTGESGTDVGSTVKGARYLSDSTVVRFGTPNTTATTFDAVASLTALNSDGTAELNWSVVDSTPRQVLWFAIGEEVAPTPPAPTPVYRTREVVRRRLRRAPIVWSEKGGLQTRVRINLFAVDMQPGVGTSDTPDPLVMIRASKDGGFTWGNERRLTAGRVGEYFERINAWQWGQGRDWVFEIACTDPVTWNLLGAYLDAEGGDN